MAIQTPWLMHGLLPVSGSVWCPGDVRLVRARTLGVTVRVTFPAAADTDATAYFYYSPDGKHYDTIAYTSCYHG